MPRGVERRVLGCFGCLTYLYITRTWVFYIEHSHNLVIRGTCGLVCIWVLETECLVILSGLMLCFFSPDLGF